MKSFLFSITLSICSILSFQAQESITATLIDSVSQNPISYATITFNNSYGVISNEQGQFLINLRKSIEDKDSLFISCLGYESVQISVKKFSDSILILSPKVFELNEILVSNKKYTVDEIIEKVKESINSNYDFEYSRSTLFYRESEFTNVSTSKITIEETTIPEFNQKFMDSILAAIPKRSDEYTELLGTKYGKINDDESQKLDIIKASRLYDKNNEITFEGFEERINSIIRENVKKDSYFKIKSGIFGTKEEMDSTIFENSASEEPIEFIEEQKKRELKQKENFLRYRKNTIANLEKNSFIFEDSDLNFLEKSNRYEFELMDFAFLNNKYVYQIKFKPKRKEDYQGTMYVNPTDFAVERIDYQNVKSLKDFSLLGLSFDHYLQKGTLVYDKNNSDKYALKFAEIVEGFKMGVKRPLKIIEKNKNVKGRRKQNEISGKIHFEVSNISKRELVIFEYESILKNEFDQFEENPSVKPTYLPAYDPEFWKGHNVIEPNQAIKDFKSIQ